MLTHSNSTHELGQFLQFAQNEVMHVQAHLMTRQLLRLRCLCTTGYDRRRTRS